jgi:ribosomal protein L40E
MSDAYDRKSLDHQVCCGCGASVSRYAVRVLHADTGVLLTRLCRRCAADLMAPPMPSAAAPASEVAG